MTTSLPEILRRRARVLETQRREVIEAPEWRERCRAAGSGC
ncbi:MAG: hypothetical protein WKF40_10205 [Thermoleophilaceae bacterium]